MSADVTFALIGITVAVMALLTYAAFRYVPPVLGEDREGHEEHEEHEGRTEPSAGSASDEPDPPGGNVV